MTTTTTDKRVDISAFDSLSNVNSLRCPSTSKSQTLQEALQSMGGDPPCSIPFIVWLLENPDSPISLSGKIDLYRHDCLHVLLGAGFSLYEEAFVVGFTMGNDVRTSWADITIFKLFSLLLYPKVFRFNQAHLKMFDLGVDYGSSVKVRNLNQVDFSAHKDQPLEVLRDLFGIGCGDYSNPSSLSDKSAGMPTVSEFPLLEL